MEFLREYPDDAACLEYLWRTKHSPDGEHARCPKCDTERSFKRYETSQRRQAWTCTACGHHIHPTAGTIFHKSSTSLHLWFYAIYLVSSSKCGIAAKQLEREIGVNYKTALRMLQKIRTDLMAQDNKPLSGKVEADEAYIGGQLHQGERSRLQAQGSPNRGPATKIRPVIFAAVERGGSMRAEVIGTSEFQARTAVAAREKLHEFVLPQSMVFTDEYGAYNAISHRYDHRRIRHSQRVYVSGDVHTNTVEGFFGHFKTDVRGTHHSISKRWLGSYLNQWVWQWNHRKDDEAMFRTLLLSAARPG
ncbi:MAG: IS1595 family transposase [Actinomycetota bacterium]|nr:IS1595 family transposase [Actinomycetota bacterium]